MTSQVDTIERWQVGSNVLGLVFNWGLLGVLSIQTYTYGLSSWKYPASHKAAVYFLWLWELLQTILLTVELLKVVTWQPPVDFFWFSLYIITSITSAAVQMYYARRIHSFSNRRILSGIVYLLSAVQLGVGITTGVSLKLEQMGMEGSPFLLLLLIWLVVNAGANVMIAITMAVMLSKGKWICMGQSNGIIGRLATVSVETGSLTASFSLVALGLLFTPQKPVAAGAVMLLSKLSACMVMASRNNPALDQAAYRAISLNPLELSSTFRGESGYENANVGMKYVPYGP